ncbi:amidase [Vitreoscilla massiliensis]|uniref:Amidase n=1 Tax=Vitreoscilla massiliensis TaxID=1689272 RepID=A0ABY4E9N5_9NEIS|nr:amidase [Vitreoscilla massiliensis]UOO90132.1 amidase [Vitreoscilla massiliensis]
MKTNQPEYCTFPLTELLKLLDTGAVTVPEIIRSYYHRIAEREPEVLAWQYLVSQENYLAQYEAQREFYEQSALKGLPFAVKDVIDTAHIPTRMGSDIHNLRIPAMDASCVTAIKAAGGIVMGKTVTTEFAYFKAGKTNNPHDKTRTPGGSSSGSAAAVADFMVPFAFGTQTAASVIRPAAYCGSVGYVGSKNEYSLRNIQPLAQSLDSLGIISNDVNDTLFIRNILLQKSPAAVSLPSSLRFSSFDGSALGPIEDGMALALQNFVGKLSQQGHQAQVFEHSDAIAELTTLHGDIMAYEVARNLVYETSTGQISAQLNDLIKTGLALPYEAYVAKVARVEVLKQALLQWWQQHNIDVLIAPAAPGVAPLKETGTGAPFMSRPWQVLGLPTVTIPLTNTGTLPLAVQLIGKPKSDDFILTAAGVLAQAQ